MRGFFATRGRIDRSGSPDWAESSPGFILLIRVLALIWFSSAVATVAHADDPSGLEARFDSALSKEDLSTWLQAMSDGPNHVGSPHNEQNARFLVDQFRSWGWKARLETFHVLVPTPRTQTLQLLSPSSFTADLREKQATALATTVNGSSPVLPAFAAYGADGDVTAKVVYVNQGMPGDYAELEQRGISVQGKIVIVRYGGGWRGLKVRLAQEHGASAVLIYSDPQDDGYVMSDTVPGGNGRPPDGIQRGSVLDTPLYPGDPLTPGIGATPRAARLSLKDARTLPRIPVLPLSYADALPFLTSLGGPIAPESWRGGLPITYHVGPGPALAHMAVASDWRVRPIHNVIATIRGRDYPDEWVIRGNHRDAWVYGAWDPLSGTVAMMAEAKAIGALARAGWRPKRTLIYASWDAEELGLMGSTEWVETHATELNNKAVLYINSDVNGQGWLNAGGSPVLQRLVNEVADEVLDPQTSVSVRTRLRARTIVEAFDGDRGNTDPNTYNLSMNVPIDLIGSGSDHTPFLHHLGIATLSLSYGGYRDPDGVYHSAYDTFDHYRKFTDPGFGYGILEAKTVGRVVLRSADADFLPFNFSELAEHTGRIIEDVRHLTDRMRAEQDALARISQNRVYELAGDPDRSRRAGPVYEVPALDFAPLNSAQAALAASAATYDEAIGCIAKREATLSPRTRVKLNKMLRGMERITTYPDGLPGRPWFRNLLYAPGYYSGYGVSTLPGVREPLERQDWQQATRFIGITARALTEYARQLDRATALLKEQQSCSGRRAAARQYNVKRSE